MRACSAGSTAPMVPPFGLTVPQVPVNRGPWPTRFRWSGAVSWSASELLSAEWAAEIVGYSRDLPLRCLRAWNEGGRSDAEWPRATTLDGLLRVHPYSGGGSRW